MRRLAADESIVPIEFGLTFWPLGTQVVVKPFSLPSIAVGQLLFDADMTKMQGPSLGIAKHKLACKVVSPFRSRLGA